MREQEDLLPGKGSALWGRGGGSSSLASPKRMRVVVAALALVVALTAPSAAFAAKPDRGGVDLVANWTE